MKKYKYCERCECLDFLLTQEEFFIYENIKTKIKKIICTSCMPKFMSETKEEGLDRHVTNIKLVTQ